MERNWKLCWKTVSCGFLFLTGDCPTREDYKAAEVLKSHLNSLPDYHNIFAWFCLVSRFSNKAIETWPQASGLCLTNESVLAAKKDDEIDDLFGDDNGEAEASAPAAKVAKQQTALKKIRKWLLYY